MNLSTFSSNPLVEDIVRQRTAVRIVLTKTVVFVCLLLAIDWLVGNFLRRGIDKYYGLDRSADILCVGHSHIVLGLDEKAVESATGLRVAKYAVEGANVTDRDAMIRHYLERQSVPPRVVVYAVDLYSLGEDGLSSNSYQLFFPYLDSQVMREHVQANAMADEHVWLRRYVRTSRYNSSTLALSIRGWCGLNTNLKNGRIDVGQLARHLESGKDRHSQPIAIDKRTRDKLTGTVAYLRKRGIPVILLCTPTVSLLNDPGREGYSAVMQFYEELAAKDDGVLFLNYTPELETRHELFFDPIHLNSAGKQVLTDRFIADLLRPPCATLLQKSSVSLHEGVSHSKGM
jgi:hypothetical protein